MIILSDKIPSQDLERWKYTNLFRVLKGIDFVPTDLGWSGAVSLMALKAPGAERYGDTQLWDLNSEKTKDIKFVSRDEKIEIYAQDGQWISPRIVIDAADGSDIVVIENFDGEGQYWINGVTQIIVGKNARVRHYRFFSEKSAGVHTQFTHAKIDHNGQYESFSMISGTGFLRNQIHVELKGENASCNLAGLHMLRDKQHADTTITVEHQAPRCRSSQTFKSVLDGKSRCVFQGKVHVHQKAQKTDGYQLSNALLLSPLAEMDTKPELEIYADDVKCSHGATTGQLDEEPLFYMRARGIPEEEARALLIQSFCAQAIESISDIAIREQTREKVEQWLITRA